MPSERPNGLLSVVRTFEQARDEGVPHSLSGRDAVDQRVASISGKANLMAGKHK
jgi:hypothetical protein